MLNNVKALEINDTELNNVNGGNVFGDIWDATCEKCSSAWEATCDFCDRNKEAILVYGSIALGSVLIASGIGAIAGAGLVGAGAALAGAGVVSAGAGLVYGGVKDGLI